MAGLDVLLLADGGDTAGGETGSAGTDELGEATEDFALGFADVEFEVAAEEVCCVLQVLEGVSVVGVSINGRE